MNRSVKHHKAIACMSFFLFCTSLAMSPSAVSKDFYRWTDANGTTHYTLHPPKGKESEKVHTMGGKSKSFNSKPSATAAAKPEEPTEQAVDSEPEETPPDTPQQIAQKKENCERAKNNIKALQEKARVRIKDGDNYRFLGEDEVKKQIIKSKEAVKKFC